MYVPKLHMQSLMGKIGIQTTNAALEVRQPKARLSIEQPKANIEMQTKKPVLHIDQTEAWAEAGIKSTERVIREQAQEGYQAFLQGTGRRAAQGTELMQIELEGNKIVQQAEQNAYKQLAEIGLTYIPSPFAVQFDYEPGEVDIQITPRRPIVQAEPMPPTYSYTPGDVSIYMEQYPSLEINVDPLFFERV